MENKLAKVANSDRRIVYYSSSQMNKRANAIYLLAAHSVLYLGKTPEQAMRPFAQIVPPVAPWHDASPSLDTFHLSTLDVLRGILKARACGFFSFESGAFDCDEYETYEKVENGDMNWIVNGRFLAFAGPEDSRAACAALGYHSTAVEDLIPYFQMRRISTVIRLNKRYYNEQRFDRAGIAHHDMYYLDGSNPPEHILQRFLHVCESTRGAIAVHCKAGLGRTGTCIGAYIMKHYRFTAREVIGWMRVCRPGSVIGPQQQFLEEIQQRMWDNGEAFRRSNELPAPAEGSYFATFVEQARKAATVLPSGSPPNVSTSSISSFGGNTSYIPLSIKTQNSTIDKFQHQQHQHLSNARSDLSLKNVSIPHQRIPSSSPIALQGSSSSPSSNSYYSSSSVEGGGGHGSGLESKFAAASSSSSTSYISGMRDALDYETMRSGASAIPFSRSLSTGATNGGGGNNNVGGGGGGRSSGVSADSSAFSTPYLSGLKGGVASGNGFHRLGGGGGGVMVTSSSSLSSSTLVNSQGDLLRTAKNNVRTSPLSLSLKSPSMGLSRR